MRRLSEPIREFRFRIGINEMSENSFVIVTYCFTSRAFVKTTCILSEISALKSKFHQISSCLCYLARNVALQFDLRHSIFLPIEKWANFELWRRNGMEECLGRPRQLLRKVRPVNQPVGSVFRSLWFASLNPDSICYSPPNTVLDFAREFFRQFVGNKGNNLVVMRAGYPLVCYDT